MSLPRVPPDPHTDDLGRLIGWALDRATRQAEPPARAWPAVRAALVGAAPGPTWLAGRGRWRFPAGLIGPVWEGDRPRLVRIYGARSDVGDAPPRLAWRMVG